MAIRESAQEPDSRPPRRGPKAQGGDEHTRPRARRLESDETERLALALALAFRDNPLNRAVIRGTADQRLRSNRFGMAATLAATRGQATILVPGREAGELSGPDLGGLIALGPGAWPLPPPPFLAQIEFWLGQGLRTSYRWGRVWTELADLHLLEPHWYLQMIGVVPGSRANGVGSSLLETWLEEVDQDRVPAYLETDRRENLDFYARHDFEVLSCQTLCGIPIWRMLRPASVF
ncbi:MAG: hypothetical protein OSB70_03065 [Myxococcota bacterium]|nr:hypothetical protein [Myxococcota bacterium]